MSAKARLGWLMAHGLRLAGGQRAATARVLVRTSGAESRRPRRAVPGSGAPTRILPTTRKTTRKIPAARAPRKKAAPDGAAAQILRQVRTAFGIDADRAEGFGSPAAEQERTGSQLARAGRRARRLRRPRRNRQSQSRTGGDAVRTRARARHQIVPRHRPCRRHRAIDERAVGARRRRGRPQRHRHRTAERASRKSLFARIAHR